MLMPGWILSCYDRLILSGTIPEISYSQGMTKYMYQNEVRIFDYPKFAEPFKETIRVNAEQIAKENLKAIHPALGKFME